MSQGSGARVDRRDFLRWGAVGAGSLAIAGPLQAFAARVAVGAPTEAEGFGALIDVGELLLPPGFRYRIISRSGRTMSDGNPTPTNFDGMGAFRGPNGSTVLIRNHENRRANTSGEGNEVTVRVPAEMRYDAEARFNAGNTKLVVSSDRHLMEDFAVLGGTTTNCAGGSTPWGSWITCEEWFQVGSKRHGYIFEVDASATGPVRAHPVRAAGRFWHEAVAWLDGVLYETEDRPNAAFYRFLPDVTPRHKGQLAAHGGTLQALAVEGMHRADTRSGWPVGESFPVRWVTIDEPDPATNTLRDEAHDKGAAVFARLEGATPANGKIYFDCTEGGEAELGQIWRYDPAAEDLTLIYESQSARELMNPDNLTVAPNGDLFICEDATPPQFIRGLTPDGLIYDFAVASRFDAEFAGACFSPDRRTFFVNQFGNAATGERAVTYAIWGPWGSRM